MGDEAQMVLLIPKCCGYRGVHIAGDSRNLGSLQVKGHFVISHRQSTQDDIFVPELAVF